MLIYLDFLLEVENYIPTCDNVADLILMTFNTLAFRTIIVFMYSLIGISENFISRASIKPEHNGSITRKNDWHIFCMTSSPFKTVEVLWRLTKEHLNTIYLPWYELLPYMVIWLLLHVFLQFTAVLTLWWTKICCYCVYICVHHSRSCT